MATSLKTLIKNMEASNLHTTTVTSFGFVKRGRRTDILYLHVNNSPNTSPLEDIALNFSCALSDICSDTFLPYVEDVDPDGTLRIVDRSDEDIKPRDTLFTLSYDGVGVSIQPRIRQLENYDVKDILRAYAETVKT